jgi:predicted RNA binding protein YcfA (HicA-like mRNA interferase family)
MKMPRDISGQELIKQFKKLGYSVTRQSGRLTTSENGEHHITIPNHSQLKIGTLSAILTEVANHFNKSKDEIVNDLFG